MSKWRGTQTPAYPLLLRPELVPKVWGGRRLASLYGASGMEPLGEAWLVSDHPRAQTVVLNGALAGAKLGEALRACATRAERSEGAERGFELLVKLIESSEPLSVQVHPDDVVARELENEAWGKTEAWYVLESAGGHVGLSFAEAPPARTAEFLASAALAGLVRKVEVQRDDFVYVPSGEIHYIGAGVLLMEVQQSSDLTYRIHDWGRTGRELHLEQAVRALRWEARAGEELRVRGRRSPEFGAGCPFRMERIDVEEGLALAAERIARVLVPLGGQGTMEHSSGSWAMPALHGWLIPAGVVAQVRCDEPTSAMLCWATGSSGAGRGTTRRAAVYGDVAPVG